MNPTVRVPIIDNPSLFDKGIGELQNALADGLPWLNFVFGKSQKTTRMINKKRYTMPSVYIEAKEYLDLAPDLIIGNFAFFVLEDPQRIMWEPNLRGDVTSDFSIVFWFDYRTLPPELQERNTERIKEAILKLLNRSGIMSSGHITLDRIYEKGENIYKGYSVDEIENQYLMHPFGGLRFEGKITVRERC